MHGQTLPLGGMLVWFWVVEAQNQRNVLLPAWLISRVIVYARLGHIKRAMQEPELPSD
jgi:hypothetical protein